MISPENLQKLPEIDYPRIILNLQAVCKTVKTKHFLISDIKANLLRIKEEPKDVIIGTNKTRMC